MNPTLEATTAPHPLSVGATELVALGPSAIHGLGGFARKDLPAGTRVIEYVGEKISRAESLRRCQANNHYIFVLDDEYHLDGNVPWNPARFLNHSCDPNCEAICEHGRIWIVALRDIRAGEELTFNYGYDLQDYRDYPCRCGAANCVGYIVAEEFFDHVRRQAAWADHQSTRQLRPGGPGLVASLDAGETA